MTVPIFPAFRLVALVTLVALAALALVGIIGPEVLPLVPFLGPVLAPAQTGQTAAPTIASIPFVAASHEHIEPAFANWVVTPGANAQDFEAELPAAGYLRSVLIEVSGTGGALGAGAVGADFPFNIFESVALYDTNGAPIFGPLDGFAAMLANLYGGYIMEPDTRQDSQYNAAYATPAFAFRIPVEISADDALGAISNMSAAAAYRIRLRVRPNSQLVTGGTPTAPVLTIRGHIETWTVPDDTDLVGRPQQQIPPGHGTSQYWSNQIQQVVNGQNTLRFPRVGNLIRLLILVARDATGARTDTVMPDGPRLALDGRDLQNYNSRTTLRRLTNEKLPDAVTDAGVFVFPFNHFGGRGIGAGAGNRNGWLATVQSARLELFGTAGAQGTLQVVTNDVAPVEVVPVERYVETSQTGIAASGARAA